jgi:molecular chaperone GrpE
MTHDPMQDAVDAAGDAAQIDELEALRAELEQLKAQSLIERADLENQRKRLAREVEMARRFANERLLGDLLPLFDAIEAGLANAAADDPLRAGLELTLRQLQIVAGKNGLAEVAPAAGDAFDPERHQAMSMIDAEGVAPGAVAQTFQKGYVLNERLLRPALVVVARHD